MVATPSSAAADRSTQFGRRLRRLAPLYLAVSPFYIVFACFGAFPLVFSLWLSVNRWDGIGDMEFIGLRNFALLLQDPVFFQSIATTVRIFVMATVPMLALALFIAVLLNSKVKFISAYRISYFVPSITSLVSIAIIFGSIFGNTFGVMNALLRSIGVDEVPWLTSPLGIQFTIAVMMIWQYTGYNAILYLAGLQTISPELYEAATMDGANSRQSFFHVTIPQLRPVILFTVVMSTIGGLQLFTQPQVLVGNQGGTERGGLTMSLYLYNQAFVNNNFGYAAAIGWALVAIVLFFSILNYRLGRSGDAEE